MQQVFDLVPFLDAIHTNSCTDTVVCFRAKDGYPLLFFTRMIETYNHKHGTSIVSIDMQQVTKQQLCGQLETSFLGTTTTYWLRNIHDLSSREKAWWLEYCARYTGPHSLWVFTTDEIDSFARIVSMPTVCTIDHYMTLARWFGIALTPYHIQFIKKLFMHQSHGITLDTACLMIEYMQIIGSDHEQFFNDILHRIIPSDASLFALSSAFMAKKSTQFYAQWRQLGSLYSEQFWCSFFSDLLWRGADYVRLASKNDMIGARKIAYRLPFSFIKSDWRSVTKKELVAAHAFIFDADFRFKNSSGYAAFDLFFSSFFVGAFNQ